MIATVTLNPSLDEWISLPALRQGALNRASSLIRYPGGKGINVSRVIHELGGSTVAFALSGGADGLILRELMSRMRIRHVFEDVGGLTRNNYKILTERPETLTEINTAGPLVRRKDLARLQRRVLRLTPKPSHIVLSGSLPPGASPTVYGRWIHLFRRRATPVVLDASGEALRRGLEARPWFIKPNRQEAEELLGRRLRGLMAVARAARELSARGPALVILSLGREGAVLAAHGSGIAWFGRSPTVKTRSAVGAGDSLIGGFLAGWTRSRSLPEAFRLGIAAGAATAMTPGTELCHRADVRRLAGRVALRRINLP